MASCSLLSCSGLLVWAWLEPSSLEDQKAPTRSPIFFALPIACPLLGATRSIGGCGAATDKRQGKGNGKRRNQHFSGFCASGENSNLGFRLFWASCWPKLAQRPLETGQARRNGAECARNQTRRPILGPFRDSFLVTSTETKLQNGCLTASKLDVPTLWLAKLI